MPSYLQNPGIRILSGYLALFLTVSQVPVADAAQEDGSVKTASPAMTLDEIDAELERARALLKRGDYDEAIESLETALPQTAGDVERMRGTYLLLIRTYVQNGNYYAGQPQGRVPSELAYARAEDLIRDCLRAPELRDTRPDPNSPEYPLKMIELFEKVRSETFGGFRIVSLDPVDADVYLDGELLKPLAGDSLPGDASVEVGRHEVRIVREGYKEILDEIAISPHTTLESPYQMQKKHGVWWYASRVGVAVAAVGGIVLATVAASGDETPPQGDPQDEEPLPGPPSPP